MNGSNDLLDTNFILGILKSNPAVIAEVSSRSVYTSECFYSVVTRMELLGYHGITADEECLSKIYLFSNNRYIRFTDVSAGHDEGYPQKISGKWPDMPTNFYQGIDAALYRHDNGKIYLFKGDQYVRFSTAGDKLTFEANSMIAASWPGLPESFQQGIDAAFWRKSNGRIYFFKGSQYARFRLVDGKPKLDYVKPIAVNWPGLPASFETGIDAALMRCSNDKIYFFKGCHYVRYLDLENRMDGGLHHINDSWMPFPK